MAAPRENLLSLGNQTGTERNTFTKQRQGSLKKSVNRPMQLQADFSSPQSHQHLQAMQLQQRWQELKQRELIAQQHNRQLLQQFEEAQDTLREMLTLTAAMKTIRMEYERYLEESTPRWQQQLKEKTQAAQRKRMEEYLRSCLKNTDERVAQSSTNRSLSQGPTTKQQNIVATQKHYSYSDSNQDSSPHLPYMQSSWETHHQPQTARFPITAPYQPPGSCHVPPAFLPRPLPLQLHHPPRVGGFPAASPQPDYPWSWTPGAAGIGSAALWGQVCTEEPPPERGMTQDVGEQPETSRAPSSKRERGGGSTSSHLSQELDIKPVRLSSSHAESSESSRESSQASGEKRKRREKRGRSQHSSSDRGRCSSQESSGTSSAIVTAAASVAPSSDSDASSVKSRSRKTKRSGGLAVGSTRAEKFVKERTRSGRDDSESHEEESQSTGEELRGPTEESRSGKARDGSPDEESESCGEESGSQREEESGSVCIKIENRGGDEIEEEESGSSEERSVGEKEHDEDVGDGDDDEENSQTDEEQEERDVEEASERQNTTEDEEEAGGEGEMEERERSDGEQLKNEDEVDEDESEDGEDKIEDDDESDEEEEERGDEEREPEEERDSEDSIIVPLDNKSKRMHVIPEEPSKEEGDDEEEEKEGSKTGSSDDDSNEFSDEDIEHLLAPQEQSQKKEQKDQSGDEKPKAICDKVEIFQVTDQQCDSDEFDHFYD